MVRGMVSGYDSQRRGTSCKVPITRSNMANSQSEVEASCQLQEPRFWTRYSPHHEFPLSAATSFFTHVLALGVIGLILTGFLGNLLGSGNRSPVPVGVITLAEGSGGQEG